MMVEASLLARYRGGVPVYRYVADPAAPPVSVIRLPHPLPTGNGAHPHVHDFPVLLYFDRDATPAPDAPPVRAGDVYLVAPGVVLRPDHSRAPRAAEGIGILFSPDALGPEPPPSWRSHPLLFPFVHGTASGLLRLRVPVAERSAWTARIAALETELATRRDGYRQAAMAHLTLLLVDVARLADDVVGDLRRSNEKLLADVFEIIERRFSEALSPRDIARAVNLSAGHLSTVVRRRTGRTLQDWITDRRMAEGRRLLAETDLGVAEVSRAVGFTDPGYFARRFRAEHGATPREWRARALSPASQRGVRTAEVSAPETVRAPRGVGR